MRPRPQWGQGWRKGVIITKKKEFLQSKKTKKLLQVIVPCIGKMMNFHDRFGPRTRGFRACPGILQYCFCPGFQLAPSQ